jgi:hypothetical protein
LHCSTLPSGINPFAVNNNDDDGNNNNNNNDFHVDEHPPCVFQGYDSEVWWMGTNNKDEYLVLLYRPANFPPSS